MVVIALYSAGKVSPLQAAPSMNFLLIGILGVVIAQLLKTGIIGKSLTPFEVFQNVLLIGLLGASSGRVRLLQSPSSWPQLLMFSSIMAALAFVIYQVTNARSLASSHKHLKFSTAIMIAAIPFLFNWILLVENGGLLQAMGNVMTLGLIGHWPLISENLGRVLVVFLFNEAIVNGFAIIIKGRAIKTMKAHRIILLVSAGVIIAPLIADMGSTRLVASLPVAFRAIAVILTSMLSYAGLWGEVYLVTGVLLDSGHRVAPTLETISKNVRVGSRKGMAYSGLLMAILFVIYMLTNMGALHRIVSALPYVIGVLTGAAVFPLAKTIIETFDGSIPFFQRARHSYRNWSLSLRGAVVGYGFTHMLTHSLIKEAMGGRILFGLCIGLIASGGVSIIRDAIYAFRGQGKIQSWKMYLIDSLLGGFVGSAGAFYLDSLQVPVVIEKFKLYVSSGFPAVEYITYPLVNKWGRIDLGTYTGGSKLLFLESLAGVINWSIAAWLFAINKVFMQAFFQKDKAPIKFFFSKAGFAELIEHMIYVLRWGLWMAPIIFTFLRMMPDPTWYNQDGAVRSIFATYNNLTMSTDAFRAWSTQIFIYIMAYDVFRVLIWMDHMGLRVATLVNLSFIGLDRLDEKVARFIGPATAQRYIPDAVKRFATWAPLLIPFYIPRGNEWNTVWSTTEAMQSAAMTKSEMFSGLGSLAMHQLLLLVLALIIIFTGISFAVRRLHNRARSRRIKSLELSNREYKVVVKDNGEAYSEVVHNQFDVSRRSYDIIDPCGRILFLADASESANKVSSFWPVLGNFPRDSFKASEIEQGDGYLKVTNTSNDVKTTLEIRLPDQSSTAEIWNVTVENMTDKPRRLKLVPYMEWLLNGWIHDRFHTQYARLFPEMEYSSQLNAILAWHKATKAMGILASDIAPEGFLTNRVDFIGRARSIWSPYIFETMDFLAPRDTASYPTFDPIGSIVVNVDVAPGGLAKARFMIGYAKNKKEAVDLIKKNITPQSAKHGHHLAPAKKKPVLIGHGTIPPGTPQPYSQFADNGNKLVVRTPFTPRPYDHAMSNAIHSVMVTNRGLHTSCNGNSQQNRLTPDWPDMVTKEIPTEAFYLYDTDTRQWYSPTYHPLNDPAAKTETEFCVDGTSVFRMKRGSVSTELTVFVPHDEPTGVYMLTIKNDSDRSKRIRVALFFEMALAFQPERSGNLKIRHSRSLDALFYENPRNEFRVGPAFVSMTAPAERYETRRGRFFGTDRGVKHPFFVEKGQSDSSQYSDDRQIASLLSTMDIPAHGERTIAVILGQADTMKEAKDIVRKYKSIDTIRTSLEETRKWWLSLMGTAVIETNHSEFNHLQNWLKYQTLAERIWARRGFYQTSGAYGFRDQLQDTVNLLWVDPSLARKQIALHASHQFLEGDVYHWFFTRTDGRTAFACRSHASDNPIWLVWGVVEYIRATSDYSILDDMASYVVSQFPFAPLPANKQGWGHQYHRSTHADSIYKHCMRSIDLVLKKRMGKHGLPLIGTGDWNDGLDEIGSEGRGESIWLGFFLHYILKDMVHIIEKKEGKEKRDYYENRMKNLDAALEGTWRKDRYLRAIHDDGTEIGIEGSGVWEIDALTAAWAVMSGINFDRGLTIFNTALKVLEKDKTILLGWPALREDMKPYLGRSSKYPEGVRENGMYCHGVQWLVRAARILAETLEGKGDYSRADEYRRTAYRLWLKISPIWHVTPEEIEIYGGQPNKQSADILTNFDHGRMIWHGYTGAAGWMLRQAFEGVAGVSLRDGELVLPSDINKPRGDLKVKRVHRDVKNSPLKYTETR